MAFNGSGTYVLPGPALVTGEIVSATENNTFRNDVASALTLCVTRDGQSPATADLPMGNHKLTGLAVGTTSTDASTIGQVQAGEYAYLTSVSGTNTITASVAPAFAAYVAGQAFNFVAAGTNTGAATLNINALGAKDICKGQLASAAGTYSVSGSTTITITATNTFEAGQEVYLDFTMATGTALTDGKFTVVTATGSNFTITYGSSVTSTGTVTAVRNNYVGNGDIVAGSTIAVVYDGVQFQLLSGAGAGGAQAGGVIYENNQVITASYTLTTGKNGMSAGPITINSGVVVTVPSGSVWTIV